MGAFSKVILGFQILGYYYNWLFEGDKYPPGGGALSASVPPDLVTPNPCPVYVPGLHDISCNPGMEFCVSVRA